jgi:hypothetical protein
LPLSVPSKDASSIYSLETHESALKRHLNTVHEDQRVPPPLFPGISDSEDNADDSDGVADDMEEEEEPEADRIALTIDGAFCAGVEGGQWRGSVKEQIGVQAAREFAQGEIVEDGKRVRYRESHRVEIETFRGAGWPYDADSNPATFNRHSISSDRPVSLCTASRSDQSLSSFRQ